MGTAMYELRDVLCEKRICRCRKNTSGTSRVGTAETTIGPSQLVHIPAPDIEGAGGGSKADQLTGKKGVGLIFAVFAGRCAR